MIGLYLNIQKHSISKETSVPYNLNSTSRETMQLFKWAYPNKSMPINTENGNVKTTNRTGEVVLNIGHDKMHVCL